jgi:hypothetical protein
MNEPIAYINVEERKLEWATPIKWETPTVVKMDKIPLYTAPPKKEWVGLTEVERMDILDAELTTQSTEHFALAQAIEAKLKERNT